MEFITKKLVGIMIVSILFSIGILIIDVNAAEVKIEYEIEWEDCDENSTLEDCEFRIDWESGNEDDHVYVWTDKDEDMDDTHSFWYSIDEDDEDKLIKDFGDLPSERLIDELHGLTKTCSGIVNASFVNSETAESYSKELNECKDLQRDYKSNWEIADDNKKEAETELENCKTSLEEKRIQVDSLNNQVNQLQREETNYNQCFQDLENEKKSKQNSAILWLAIGVGLGYVLWNKKTQVGPSEQSESGVYTDLPEYRDY